MPARRILFCRVSGAVTLWGIWHGKESAVPRQAFRSLFADYNFSWAEQRQKSGISAAVQGLPGSKIVDAEGVKFSGEAGALAYVNRLRSKAYLQTGPEGNSVRNSAPSSLIRIVSVILGPPTPGI